MGGKFGSFPPIFFGFLKTMPKFALQNSEYNGAIFNNEQVYG